MLCALTKIEKIDVLFNSKNTSHENWKKVKNELVSAIPNLPFSVAPEAPPTIRGVYRGSSPFQDPLLTSSGNS